MDGLHHSKTGQFHNGLLFDHLTTGHVQFSDPHSSFNNPYLLRNHYVQQADFAANELEEEVERIVAQQAKETCQLLIDQKYKVSKKWMPFSFHATDI